MTNDNPLQVIREALVNNQYYTALTLLDEMMQEPSGDMVERVAKALFDDANSREFWRHAKETVKNKWRKRSKLAISAMNYAPAQKHSPAQLGNTAAGAPDMKK